MSLKAFTNEQARDIRKKYENGASLEALKNEFGTSLTTLARTIRRVGGTIRTDAYLTLAFNDAQSRELRTKYEAGATLQQLVDEYGTGQTPISRAIQRAGGTLRKPGGIKGKQLRPYRIKRDVLAQMVAAHISGLRKAIPEQDDYDTADDILKLLEKRAQ